MSGLFPEAALPPTIVSAPATPYRVLARKYRPTTLDELIGQDALVRILRNAFARDRVAHAFMLTGVRGVGKTTTARIIARALNCIGPDGAGGPTADPCGMCANCTAILADRHPDVVEMDAASNNGVDEVREIIESVRFRPMQARDKVFILDEVHMLSKAAFNALLKTLEEPPPHVRFIFATTELRRVPVTVVSRCQTFSLRRVGMTDLIGLFGRIAAQEAATIEPEALSLIARAADGSVRDGLSLLDQAIAQAFDGQAAESGTVTAAAVIDMLGQADRGAVFDLLEAVMAGRPAAGLAVMDRAHQLGADAGLMLADLLTLVHTVTRLKLVPELRATSELPELDRVRGAALADRLSMSVLGRAFQMLLKGVGEVESAPDRRAAAEMVLIRLCHVSELPTPGELVRRLSDPPSPPGGSRIAVGGGGGGGVVQAPVMARAQPRPEPRPGSTPVPGPSDLRGVATLAAGREPTLHAHIVHSVHLVRFAPPVIELRPEADAPRDLAARLAALLAEATGTRWTVALSAAAGAPTLAEQDAAAADARRSAACDHPMVRAVLAAFPGARIDPGAPRSDGTSQPPTDDLPPFAPTDAVPHEEVGFDEEEN